MPDRLQILKTMRWRIAKKCEKEIIIINYFFLLKKEEFVNNRIKHITYLLFDIVENKQSKLRKRTQIFFFILKLERIKRKNIKT